MPLDLNCPKCRHVFPVTEARHPVGVECPGCAAQLTAEFRRLPVPTPGEPHYELLVSVGRPPGSAAPPPAAKALKLDDEDEDGGKKRKGGSMLVVALAGLGALAVTVGGLGAVGYVLFTHMDPPETVSTRPGGGTTRPAGGGNPEPPAKKTEKPTPAPRPGEFVSAEWGFAAKFPGDPKTQRQQAAGMTVTMFVAEGKDGGCIVGVSEAPIGDNETAQQTKDRLDGAQAGAVANIGGTLKSSKDVKLGGKYPGREFVAGITKPVVGQVKARVYIVGKRLYQVMVVGTSAYVGGPEAKAFLDSFRLAD